MRTLEHEEVHLSGYETLRDVVARLPRFIAEVYDAERLHPAPGDLSPVRFEEINTRKAARSIPIVLPSKPRRSVQSR
jgi:hypothetical protein